MSPRAANPKSGRKSDVKKDSMLKSIRIVGAREHNLKNISITLPRDRLIVMTGLSGSGKSSLAFDTIYAEGQRRYVESLSAYARQFLEMMQKPDVDQIEGLSPAISIEQKTTSRNPRSTVGTVTEIYDYLRLLFARIGVPYSPATGLPIESQTVSQMVDKILALPQGTRAYLLAPLVRGRKGEYRRDFAELQKRGFQRVKVDGTFYPIEDVPPLDKKIKHDIGVVIDRLVITAKLGNRVADSLEIALELADGIAILELVDSGETILFSARFACPVSGFSIDEIEPRLFSFNNPFGACPTCDGLGTQFLMDPDAVVPEPSLSLNEGAIVPWSKSFAPYYLQALAGVAAHFNFSMDVPWKKLPRSARDLVLYGSGTERISIEYRDRKHKFSSHKPFEGVLPSLERRYRETDSNRAREEIEKFQSITVCPACKGNRLKPEPLAVKINGHHISEVTAMAIGQALTWFTELPRHLTSKQQKIAIRILKEIQERLNFLNNVGLEYLTLARNSGSLSGGESQRIRLASQIGSGLTGVLYVLDEPSIGLHQRDNARLIETLTHLRNIGNTVIVVEHDEDAIRAADHVVDIGPGAGRHGGEIVANGTPEQIIKNPKSLTGQYLSGERIIPIPKKRRSTNGKNLRITGAKEHNLKNISVDIPLGVFTCVTGVSGSGKSTLLIETLYKALMRQLAQAHTGTPGKHDTLTGGEQLDKVIDIDQSPIGRTPRSNPATYTGAFTPIREWYAGLPEAQARGYKPGRFSFNVKGGRCEACKGDGVIKIEMHFLPDVYVECDTCRGARYNRETLEVTFRGKTIADVLNMTVDEAAEFFKAIPTIRDKMETLHRVGLDYIKVGQAATTLSGGEAQRVKLARELSRRATGRTLYILDEPTTGLHFHDVAKLLEVLHTLADGGNSIIIIEHNLEVIQTADWIIDIGPEGGDGGGKIVATGTPENIAKVKKSYTGQHLARLFKNKQKNALNQSRTKSAAQKKKPKTKNPTGAKK